MATPPDSFSWDSIRELLTTNPDLFATPLSRQSVFLSTGYRDALTAQIPDRYPPNPLYQGAYQSYLGLSVRTFDIPKKTVFDWSGCRSPSRAKRRHAKGIPQRVKVSEVDVAYLVNEDALRSMQFGWERMCGKILYGGEGVA